MKNLAGINDHNTSITDFDLIIDRYECKLFNPCENDGLCNHKDGNFTCDCNGTGYEGDYCDIDIDECTIDQPCENNGICINQPGNYTCDCNGTGYKGDFCNIDIDECTVDQPCRNG